ncbi:acyltransferase family protein [Actinoallomurus rhizosphaericola]|uniref:acyltransferase family protein n=1 Tax=Actinoallomurus rhizosphaericola TaxID=2952536 RepID=UPI002092E87C|nr:acyltransferase [Actinoallomurus rhizosphaericola]MCO5994814.1 acyltransferase [Actinoallomurus rhizosphaericola]
MRPDGGPRRRDPVRNLVPARPARLSVPYGAGGPRLREEPVAPADRGRRAGAPHLPAVDGLRALAVLGVIAYHFGLPLRGGFLGVDLFFVISGYVITRLLLAERARTGTTRLAVFWARRARRLFPAVLTVLVVVQAWMHLGAGGPMRHTVNAQTLAALVYGSNWYSIFAEVGYWGVPVDRAPLNHLWSLAVEEQYYLVWPLLFVALAGVLGSRRVLAGAALLCAGCAYTAMHLFFVPGAPDRAYLGTDCRAGGLALGALLAVLTTSAAAVDRRLPARVTTPAGVLAAACLAWLWFTADLGGRSLYTWQLPVAGVAAATLIGSLVLTGDGLPARIAGSRPFVAIGKVSYSLYLWHWPIWVFLAARFPQWPAVDRVIAAAIATAVLATASYHWVENPLRHSRKPMKVMAPAFLAVAAVVACAAVLLQPPAPVEQRDDVQVSGP